MINKAKINCVYGNTEPSTAKTYYELITELNEQLYKVSDKVNTQSYELAIAVKEIKRLRLFIKIIISVLLAVILVMLGVVK